MHIARRARLKMENKQKLENENSIDLMFLLKALWKRIGIIALVTVLAGVMVFGYTKIFVKPMYSSSVVLYVNNSKQSSSSGSISSAELAAAQSLVDTYVGILQTRTTMELVISSMKDTNSTTRDYSYGQLLGMVKATPVEETEMFRITVTAPDPGDAAKIADCVAVVLPDRIETIIAGSDIRIVDGAVVNKNPSSPNVTRNTVIGMIAGFVLACAFFAVLALLDDTIQGEDYITSTFDIPVLAKIPNLATDDEKRESYYKRKKQKETEEAVK